MVTRRERLVFGLSLNVVALGLVSLFTDISTEMILAILPLFLVYDLGASAAILGVIAVSYTHLTLPTNREV